MAQRNYKLLVSAQQTTSNSQTVVKDWLYCLWSELCLHFSIHTKQACLLEVNTNINSLKLELAQVQSAQTQIEDANLTHVSALEQQKTVLAEIRHHINICLNTQQELELQTQQLQVGN